MGLGDDDETRQDQEIMNNKMGLEDDETIRYDQEMMKQEDRTRR